MNIFGFTIGLQQPFFLLAGPCVVESRQLALDTAGQLKEMCEKLAIPLVYKSSFDKANRSSHHSFRGLGIAEGLKILADVKATMKIPIVTDVHEDTPLEEVADVVDILQTPAFLCRQTNFIQKVAKLGLPMNIKKGQFLAPWEMENVVKKAKAMGNEKIMVCERGVSFGYNNLVSDMRSLVIMRKTSCPVIFDATHSVQLPGGQGIASGGEAKFIPALARAAVAVGISGLYMETHPQPEKALSDGPNSWPLNKMYALLTVLKDIDCTIKQSSLAEEDSVKKLYESHPCD
jgi:2-dehydro-3-deoxyphosphooctonate aldolase (KDO 8-P synthase)